jgi:hypothetical protein
MLSGSRYAPAEPITLGAWDVRLLRSSAATNSPLQE